MRVGHILGLVVKVCEFWDWGLGSSVSSLFLFPEFARVYWLWQLRVGERGTLVSLLRECVGVNSRGWLVVVRSKWTVRGRFVDRAWWSWLISGEVEGKVKRFVGKTLLSVSIEEMGQCYGRECATGGETWKYGAGKSSSTGSFYSLHNNCISNGTKNSLTFIKQQRAKLYIVRRCVTMLLLWHKYGK